MENTRQVPSMIHSAKPTVPSSSKHCFLLFCFARFEKCRPTCAKTMILTDRDCGLAEWINSCWASTAQLTSQDIFIFLTGAINFYLRAKIERKRRCNLKKKTFTVFHTTFYDMQFWFVLPYILIASVGHRNVWPFWFRCLSRPYKGRIS